MSVEAQKDYSLKNLTSFKIGGAAEYIYFPSSIEEFKYLLTNLETPQVMGNWSNVLVSSNGIKGNVISTKELSQVEFNEDIVTAQCGIKGPLLSKLAMEKGLSGFEFMSGFPGSVGGNVYMNASANNQSISDFFISAELFDMRTKSVICMKKEELEFAYRSSLMQNLPLVVLSAKFKLERDSIENIKSRIEENLSFRRQHQPNLSLPNVGSIFRNPHGNSAGAMLEQAGAKTFSVGGAKVWENHANFIINPEQIASSKDVLELMFMMYNAVYEKFGIRFRPEVKYIGEPDEREEQICAILYNQ